MIVLHLGVIRANIPSPIVSTPEQIVDERVGRLIAQKYQVRRLLGSGGMGSVYEAEHTGLGKPVALKTLHPRVAADPQALTRFMTEGRTASRIRHPHVVDVTDVGAVDGTPFMVMEFLEGQDLAHLIEGEGARSPEQIADIMIPVCSALAAAHAVGVIHRDLKPENIFLTRGPHGGPHPKVLDFGISKVLDPEGNFARTGTAAILGTPFYMSPEQARSTKTVEASTDQYSLGVILYEGLCGRRPFESESLYELLAAIVEANYPRLGEVAPALPAPLVAAVERAMHPDAGARYPSVAHLGSALLPFASEPVRALWAADLEKAGAATPGETSVSEHVGPVGAASAGPGPARPALTTLGGAVAEREVGAPAGGRRGLWIAGAALSLLGVGGIVVALVMLGGSGAEGPDPEVAPAVEPASPETYEIDIQVDPPEAAIELDGRPRGTERLRIDLPRDETEHTLHVRADGYEPVTITFDETRIPPGPITLAQAPPAEETRPAEETPPEEGSGDTGRPPRERRPRGERTSMTTTMTTMTTTTVTMRRTTGANDAPIVD